MFSHIRSSSSDNPYTRLDEIHLETFEARCTSENDTTLGNSQGGTPQRMMSESNNPCADVDATSSRPAPYTFKPENAIRRQIAADKAKVVQHQLQSAERLALQADFSAGIAHLVKDLKDEATALLHWLVEPPSQDLLSIVNDLKDFLRVNKYTMGALHVYGSIYLTENGYAIVNKDLPAQSNVTASSWGQHVLFHIGTVQSCEAARRQITETIHAYAQEFCAEVLREDSKLLPFYRAQSFNHPGSSFASRFLSNWRWVHFPWDDDDKFHTEDDTSCAIAFRAGCSFACSAVGFTVGTLPALCGGPVCYYGALAGLSCFSLEIPSCWRATNKALKQNDDLSSLWESRAKELLRNSNETAPPASDTADSATDRNLSTRELNAR